MCINIASLDNFNVNFHYRRSSIPIGDDSVNDDGTSLSLEETAGEMAEDTNSSLPSFITDEKHLQREQEVAEKLLHFKVAVAQAKAEADIAKAKAGQRAAEAKAEAEIAKANAEKAKAKLEQRKAELELQAISAELKRLNIEP